MRSGSGRGAAGGPLLQAAARAAGSGRAARNCGVALGAGSPSVRPAGTACALQVPQVSVVDGVFVFWSNRTCEWACLALLVFVVGRSYARSAFWQLLPRVCLCTCSGGGGCCCGGKSTCRTSARKQARAGQVQNCITALPQTGCMSHPAHPSGCSVRPGQRQAGVQHVSGGTLPQGWRRHLGRQHERAGCVGGARIGSHLNGGGPHGFWHRICCWRSSVQLLPGARPSGGGSGSAVSHDSRSLLHMQATPSCRCLRPSSMWAWRQRPPARSWWCLTRAAASCAMPSKQVSGVQQAGARQRLCLHIGCGFVADYCAAATSVAAAACSGSEALVCPAPPRPSLPPRSPVPAAVNGRPVQLRASHQLCKRLGPPGGSALPGRRAAGQPVSGLGWAVFGSDLRGAGCSWLPTRCLRLFA